MTVSATVLSKSNCKFNSGTIALSFGSIDPSSTSAATATATQGFSCAGSAPNATFYISAGNGLWYSGSSRQMKDPVSGTFMAYSLTLSPETATVPKNSPQTLTVTGTIAPSAFQVALAGTYSDTVVITLTP